MKTKYSFPEMVKVLGVSYQRLYWAVVALRVVEPEQYGRIRLFTVDDLETLRQHFAKGEK